MTTENHIDSFIAQFELCIEAQGKHDFNDDSVNKEISLLLKNHPKIVFIDLKCISNRVKHSKKLNSLIVALFLDRLNLALINQTPSKTTSKEKEEEEEEEGDANENDENGDTESTDENEEEDELKLGGRMLEHSQKSKLIDCVKNALNKRIIFKPLIFTYDAVQNIISFIIAMFLKILDFIGRLLSFEAIFDAVSIGTKKSKLIWIFVVVIETILDGFLTLLGLISSMLGWYNNPFKKITKVIQERTKTGDSGDSGDSGDDLAVEPTGG